MEILWLLIPMSAVLVLVVIGVFGWALHRGQFEDIEFEGERILQDDLPPVDRYQDEVRKPTEQSSKTSIHQQGEVRW